MSSSARPPLPAPLVPLKRKHPSPALSAITATPPLPSTSTDALSAKSKQPSHPLATSSTPPIISNHPLPNLSTKSSPAPSQRLSQQRPFSPTLSTFLPPQTSPTSQHSLASPPPPPIIHSLSLIYLFQTRTPSRASVDSLMTMVFPSHVTTVHDGAMASFKGGGEVPEIWKCWVCDPTVELRLIKSARSRPKKGG